MAPEVKPLAADPAFHVFSQIYPFEAASWEYDSGSDEVNIGDIPPTAASSADAATAGSATAREISDVASSALRRDALSAWPQDEAFLSSLQEDLDFWAENDVAIDLNRLLRCALRANLLDVAQYLISERGADVMSRDIFNRNALTYAVSMEAHSKVLDLIVDSIDDAAAFDHAVQHKDVFSNDAAFYSALGQNFPALLVRCSAGVARSRIGQETMDNLRSKGVSLAGQKYAMMSFGYLEKYLNFPVYVQHNAEQNTADYAGLFTVADLHRWPSELDLYFGTKRYSRTIPNSLIWMHMPWTNAVLLDVFYTCVRSYLNTRIPGTAGIRIEHEACRRIFHQSWMKAALAPGNIYLNYRLPSCEFFDNTAGVGLDSGGVEDEASADEKRTTMRSAVIVFPYMSLGTISSFKRIRQRHIEFCQPFHSSGIHTERTLDEEHYPSLSREVLDEYNDDQVTSRECKRTIQNTPVAGDSRPLLIVSQLWIWRFGNYLISAMTPVGSSPEDLLLERGNSYIKEYIHVINKQRRGDVDEWEDEDALPNERLIEEMTTEAEQWRTTVLGQEVRARGSEPDIQIGSLLAMQVEQFGKLQVKDTFQTPLDYYEIGVARVMSEVNEYTKYSRPEALDIEKEKRFVHEISDIRGELMMVDEVLGQQQELLETFAAGAEQSATSHRFWGRVVAVQKQLAGYRRRVAKIVRDAEHIDGIVNGALDLKRTHASIQDARASLQDARSSLLLGWAVMGFTVITVVFAPIAFMTALFALPIDHLMQNQRNTTNSLGDTVSAYPSGYVTWTFFIAEIGALVLTALAIWAALRLRDWIKPASSQENEAMGKASTTKNRDGSTEEAASQYSASDEKHSLRRRRRGPKEVDKEQV